MFEYKNSPWLIVDNHGVTIANVAIQYILFQHIVGILNER